MKTVQLTASISRRGGGLFPIVQRISQYLLRENVDTIVLGLKDKYTRADFSQWFPIHPIALKTYPPKAFGYAPNLLQTLKEVNGDLVHVHGIWMYPSWANLSWANRSRHPYIISPQGMLDGWALANSKFKKRIVGRVFENRHLAGAHCLHALSQAEVAAIRGYGLRNPICLIPNGVDSAYPAKMAAPAWRERFGRDRKVLLFLGRIHPKKGLLPLLSAWAQLKRDRYSTMQDWGLAIAGWNQNSHQQELERFVVEHSLSESVKFIGPMFGDAKIASLQTANAFVLPSFSEGLPVAVLEAWAYGLPVAMTSECNLPQGFSSGAAIKLTHGGEGIAQGLRDLLCMSDQEQTAMGQRGLKLVEQYFSWGVITNQIIEVYRWMLEGGGAPACVEAS